MEDRSASKHRVLVPFTFAALTIGWLVSSIALAYSALVVALGGGFESPSTTPGWLIKGMAVVAFTVVVFGPLVIAGVAYAVRWRRTAVGYATLSGFILACMTIQFVWRPF